MSPILKLAVCVCELVHEDIGPSVLFQRPYRPLREQARSHVPVCNHWNVRNDHSTIVRRSASHAVLDALRPVLLVLH
ncbi:hypothetical protein CVE34_15700 [Pseudomonas syringae pv. actinidiae]|uniref:Permease component n=1 Tax=Pseudomonas syringae pv. actinidiae TaxID=103796 RepID=A0AAN4QCW6_PSESF|nr:hypothetical protein CT122_02180 [Pseudomonas syringae pv. actinidiae]NAS68945.1 hypothetical protein [Pseudomonas syringae pv. actinidiae]NAS72713.1 hypothetical protein [Pseudomonas syringae pv. actinidiae]NAS91450.1 hypothetical protein [Pseudomonas syringae pv. actinidiae]NAT00589.1 hypothetical protein [Pseudomonas syringae pv. actinidiae]